MKFILSIIDINLVYLLLIGLFLMASILFINNHNLKKYLTFFIVLFLVIATITYNNVNYMFNTLFNFEYIPIRIYIMVLIITNIIALFTINKEISMEKRLINYVLFGISLFTFGINLLLFVNNFLKIVNIKINYMIIFMDIEIISFVGYLIIFFSIYIYNNIVGKKQDNKHEKILENDNESQYNYDYEEIKEELTFNNIKDISIDENNFIIDGKDCSFIFNDPNRENVIKNYYILLTNVNARLVNGYTLDENIRINNILRKLRITDINEFNLMNMDVLSKIGVDEYNLLKSYISSQGKIE